MRVLALADDTTGALEVGANLAAAGIETLVLASPALDQLPGAPGLVVDLHVRHVSADEAEAITERVARLALALDACVFLKTDSTLRGNIAAQFRALLRVWPHTPLVYVPAYPDMGRTVVGGMLYVYGRPLAETEFARDPLAPARESSILRVLEQPAETAGSAEELRRLLEAGRTGIIVCDAVSEEEVAGAAAIAARFPHLAAGPGGFARYWARAIGGGGGRACVFPAPSGPWLVVNGSTHAASRRQIDVARAAGLRWTVLAPPPGCSASPREVVARLAAETRRNVDACAPGVLIVFGGDTTFAILGELGVDRIQPAGELLPGIPLSSIEYRGRAIAMVTKAGGFGNDAVLLAIRERLREHK